MPIETSVQEKLSTLGLELRRFVPAEASDVEWRGFNAVTNRRKAEESPEDPPTKLQDTINNLKNIPDFVVFIGWALWRGDEAVGFCFCDFQKSEENQHLLQFYIYVDSELRQRVSARSY